MSSGAKRTATRLFALALVVPLLAGCTDDEKRRLAQLFDIPEITSVSPRFGPANGVDPAASSNTTDELVVVVAGDDYRENETCFELVPIPDEQLAALGLTRDDAPEFDPVKLEVRDFIHQGLVRLVLPASPIAGQGSGVVTIRATNPPGLLSNVGDSDDVLFRYVPTGGVAVELAEGSKGMFDRVHPGDSGIRYVATVMNATNESIDVVSATLTFADGTGLSRDDFFLTFHRGDSFLPEDVGPGESADVEFWVAAIADLPAGEQLTATATLSTVSSSGLGFAVTRTEFGTTSFITAALPTIAARGGHTAGTGSVVGGNGRELDEGATPLLALTDVGEIGTTLLDDSLAVSVIAFEADEEGSILGTADQSIFMQRGPAGSTSCGDAPDTGSDPADALEGTGAFGTLLSLSTSTGLDTTDSGDTDTDILLDGETATLEPRAILRAEGNIVLRNCDFTLLGPLVIQAGATDADDPGATQNGVVYIENCTFNGTGFDHVSSFFGLRSSGSSVVIQGLRTAEDALGEALAANQPSVRICGTTFDLRGANDDVSFTLVPQPTREVGLISTDPEQVLPGGIPAGTYQTFTLNGNILPESFTITNNNGETYEDLFIGTSGLLVDDRDAPTEVAGTVDYATGQITVTFGSSTDATFGATVTYGHLSAAGGNLLVFGQTGITMASGVGGPTQVLAGGGRTDQLPQSGQGGTVRLLAPGRQIDPEDVLTATTAEIPTPIALGLDTLVNVTGGDAFVDDVIGGDGGQIFIISEVVPVPVTPGAFTGVPDTLAIDLRTGPVVIGGHLWADGGFGQNGSGGTGGFVNIIGRSVNLFNATNAPYITSNGGFSTTSGGQGAFGGRGGAMRFIASGLVDVQQQTSITATGGGGDEEGGHGASPGAEGVLGGIGAIAGGSLDGILLGGGIVRIEGYVGAQGGWARTDDDGFIGKGEDGGHIILAPFTNLIIGRTPEGDPGVLNARGGYPALRFAGNSLGGVEDLWGGDGGGIFYTAFDLMLGPLDSPVTIDGVIDVSGAAGINGRAGEGGFVLFSDPIDPDSDEENNGPNGLTVTEDGCVLAVGGPVLPVTDEDAAIGGLIGLESFAYEPAEDHGGKGRDFTMSGLVDASGGRTDATGGFASYGYPITLHMGIDGDDDDDDDDDDDSGENPGVLTIDGVVRNLGQAPEDSGFVREEVILIGSFMRDGLLAGLAGGETTNNADADVIISGEVYFTENRVRIETASDSDAQSHARRIDISGLVQRVGDHGSDAFIDVHVEMDGDFALVDVSGTIHLGEPDGDSLEFAGMEIDNDDDGAVITITGVLNADVASGSFHDPSEGDDDDDAERIELDADDGDIIISGGQVLARAIGDELAHGGSICLDAEVVFVGGDSLLSVDASPDAEGDAGFIFIDAEEVITITDFAHLSGVGGGAGVGGDGGYFIYETSENGTIEITGSASVTADGSILGNAGVHTFGVQPEINGDDDDDDDDDEPLMVMLTSSGTYSARGGNNTTVDVDLPSEGGHGGFMVLGADSDFDFTADEVDIFVSSSDDGFAGMLQVSMPIDLRGGNNIDGPGGFGGGFFAEGEGDVSFEGPIYLNGGASTDTFGGDGGVFDIDVDGDGTDALTFTSTSHIDLSGGDGPGAGGDGGSLVVDEAQTIVLEAGATFISAGGIASEGFGPDGQSGGLTFLADESVLDIDDQGAIFAPGDVIVIFDDDDN